VVRWLEELSRCGLADSETRLFVVPKSVLDRTPAGLLVLPMRVDALAHQPAGLPCRRIADRLFVPLEAVLHPTVTDVELRVLCPLPVSFFHPALGLSGFEVESGLRVWDLIGLPEERAEHWNFARPGAPTLPELQAVILAQPPSIKDVFGNAPEEIGSEPPLGLPPAPNEPKEGALTKSQQTVLLWFAKGVAGAMRQIPHTGVHRTWVNDIEDWAARRLHGVNNQLERTRNKELHRLLHLFDNDPESALRHAIPMNAFAHRGIAPPGAYLGPRPLNFDWSRLGGGAADFWNVPPNLQELLRLRYREMADREMQLGRHRRAAYIYAGLLGDLVSAANALKQGKHFREAALLYDEQLKSPLDAARCLAEGGLLAEAIERYEKLGRWIEVADLQQRLGLHEAARENIRRVVNERIAQDDILGAAKLVEERLHGNDEALEMLLQAWPSSRQAAGCIGAAFQMLARLCRHGAALECLAKFARDPVPRSLVLPLLNALGGPVRDYPDEPVRHRAADFSRVLIARQLGQPALPKDESSRLMECLVRLAPQDRLLSRDANRHLAGRREQELRMRRVTPPPLSGSRPVVVRRLELPRQMEWLQLRNEWHWFYAVGVTENRLTFVRGVWTGELQSVSWNCSAESVKNTGLILEPTGERGSAVLLKTGSGPDFEEKLLPPSDSLSGPECVVGTAAWAKPQHWPMAFGVDGLWTAHVAGGRGIISSHDKRGTLQRTIDVTEDLLSGAERSNQTRLCLSAIGNQAAIALGNRLVVTSSEGTLSKFELPGQVVALAATLPHTRAGLAVMLEHGAAMYWLGAPGLIELDRDIASSQGVFVPGGPLVLISDAQVVLLDVDSRGVQKVTRVEVTGQRPVGVSATDSVGQFAVLGAKGEMKVYQVPR
jgi:tetratricopeptide (TPR) repeat protein